MSETPTIREQIERRDATLARLGFTASFVTSADFGGQVMASCLACGAAVRIDPAVTDDSAQPAVIHRMWHEGVSS